MFDLSELDVSSLDFFLKIEVDFGFLTFSGNSCLTLIPATLIFTYSSSLYKTSTIKKLKNMLIIPRALTLLPSFFAFILYPTGTNNVASPSSKNTNKRTTIIVPITFKISKIIQLYSYCVTTFNRSASMKEDLCHFLWKHDCSIFKSLEKSIVLNF